MKKEKINRNILEILKPFNLTNEKDIKKAFQAVVEKYPEIVLFEIFKNILTSTKNKEEIADRITNYNHKNRATRKDAYTDDKKLSNNQKRRKRNSLQKKSDLREALRKAHEIITCQHIKEWEQNFGIDKRGWFKLFLKVSEAFYRGIEVRELPEFTGCSTKALNKIMDEYSVLWNVLEKFKGNLKKAIERKNNDDKTFLNTVKDVWGRKGRYVLGDLCLENRGKPVNKETRQKRYQRVIKNMKKNKLKRDGKGSELYTRDIPIFLCRVAYIAYTTIFAYPLIEIKLLEYASRRLKIISEIQRGIDEYKILSSELNFKKINTQPAVNVLPDLSF